MNFQTLKKKNYFTLCLGRPIIEGNTALGDSSPENPALHSLDPLSITIAGTSSPCILNNLKNIYKCRRSEMRFTYKNRVYKRYSKIILRGFPELIK